MDDPIKKVNTIKDYWAKSITKWEKINGRNFSWRKNRTPYRVLISEVLLKRTSSTAAIRLYEEFLKGYPDINSLKKSSRHDLELILQPIGLYRQRAKQLKQIAEHIVEEFDGEIPSEYEVLLEIPGIGDYTASAITCFSYNKTKAIVDSNVERILKRAFNVRGKQLKTIADILIDPSSPDLYNYGMLDLGATICNYRFPECPKCPVKKYCSFGREI